MTRRGSLVTAFVMAASVLAPLPATATPPELDRAPALGVLPQSIAWVENLECPADCVAVGGDDEGADYFLSGSDGGRTWTVQAVPGSTGVDTFVLGLECASATLCYAWGATGGPTIWWTTTPGRGGWRAQVLPIDAGEVETMTCATETSCVAVTTTGSDVGSSEGQVWWTPAIGAGQWSSQPMPAAYRVFDVTCSTASLCVASGQGNALSGTERATMTFWSTANVAAGGWGRVEPRAGNSDGVNVIKSLQCFGASQCVANGEGVSSAGLLDTFVTGYWVTTNPTGPDTSDWVWHQTDGVLFKPGPLSCASPTLCLAWDGRQTMRSDPDVQDQVAGAPLALPMENWGNLRSFGCFTTDSCYAWGSDSGSASGGPLMRTRLWRGSSLGGAWSVAPLPDVPGYAGWIPRADVSCNPASCTAVGVLAGPGTYSESVGPVVWATDSTGAWRVVAASPTVDPSLATPDASAVRTRVSLRARPRTGVPDKLVGTVRARQRCERQRTVVLVGRHGRSATKVRSDRNGRFTIRLNPKIRQKLARRAHVKVRARRSDAVVCLAARSPKVRVR